MLIRNECSDQRISILAAHKSKDVVPRSKIIPTYTLEFHLTNLRMYG
jgi:hypothetical protein